jgi:hypothetical protein
VSAAPAEVQPTTLEAIAQEVFAPAFQQVVGAQAALAQPE